jgi:hypothetical protein
MRVTSSGVVRDGIILRMNFNDLEYKGVDWINPSRDKDGLLLIQMNCRLP